VLEEVLARLQLRRQAPELLGFVEGQATLAELVRPVGRISH